MVLLWQETTQTHNASWSSYASWVNTGVDSIPQPLEGESHKIHLELKVAAGIPSRGCEWEHVIGIIKPLATCSLHIPPPLQQDPLHSHTGCPMVSHPAFNIHPTRPQLLLSARGRASSKPHGSWPGERCPSGAPLLLLRKPGNREAPSRHADQGRGSLFNNMSAG